MHVVLAFWDSLEEGVHGSLTHLALCSSF
jgi:hypothetical protein